MAFGGADGIVSPARIMQMQRLLLGLFVCALATAVATAVAPPADENAAEAFQALEKEFQEKLGGYKNLKERQLMVETYTKKFLAHAHKNPKDESAFDALCWVLRINSPSDDKGSPYRQAFAAIKQQHVKSKRIASALAPVGQRSDRDGAELLSAVIAANPNRKTQAACVRMMKLARESLVKIAERLRDDKAHRERIEQFGGQEFVKNLIDNRSKFAKEAKYYEKMLAEKYPGVFPDVTVGKPAPEVIAENLDGQKVKLSDHKGKVVVLDVWATWCGPCLAMTPHSKKLVAAMKGRPFVFVGVSADEKKETVRAFLKKHEMPWTHWWVGSSEGLMEDWQIGALPTIYLIDARGVLREVLVGADHEKLAAVAERLVQEAERKK